MAMTGVLKSPWVWGAAGLLLLLLVMRSGGGGNSRGGSPVQSQGLADSANVQLAGLSTQLQATQDHENAALAVGSQLAFGQIFASLTSFMSNLANANAAVALSANQVNGDIAKSYLTTHAMMTIGPQIAAMNQGPNNVNANANIIKAQFTPQIAQIDANAAISIAQTNAVAMASIAQSRGQAANTSALGGVLNGAGNLVGSIAGGGGGGGGFGSLISGIGSLFGGGGGAAGAAGGAAAGAAGAGDAAAIGEVAALALL